MQPLLTSGCPPPYSAAWGPLDPTPGVHLTWASPQTHPQGACTGLPSSWSLSPGIGEESEDESLSRRAEELRTGNRRSCHPGISIDSSPPPPCGVHHRWASQEKPGSSATLRAAYEAQGACLNYRHQQHVGVKCPRMQGTAEELQCLAPGSHSCASY